MEPSLLWAIQSLIPTLSPHITSFSFLLGHYCLLINSLIYLLRWYDRNLLKNSQIVLYTFALDLFLVGVNQLTGGNYGLMARPPIMRGDKVWLNYLVVSSILALAYYSLISSSVAEVSGLK